MPPTVAGEERGRETLAHLAERFALERGNWEVDCGMVESSSPKWAADEHYPKCPLALAELHEGSIHPVRITVSRDTAPRPSPEEGPRC